MRPTQGVTFGGRYELDSRIAIGGMGEVWEATDHVIGRTVAIKILKDEYMGDPGFLERFRAEARHAALVNHEGIASVFDYGEEAGSAFLVMELVPGEALSTVLEREGALSTDKTLDIVAQTAAALQAAHAAGLVHRDIKPGNLLITPDGRVKITDFGIARIADQVPLTATGQVMGTVQYLSPEQASGHPASPATDTYSLGIVAYEILAGRRPFTGESQVAIAMAQINEQAPPLPPTVAEPVQNLVMAMIAKKPEDRPASSAAVAQGATALRRGDVAAAIAAIPAIGGGLDDSTKLLTPAGDTSAATQLMTTTAAIPEEEPEKKKRSPWTWPLIALIVLLFLVLGGTVWALIAGGDDAEPTPSPTRTSAAPTQSETPTQSSTPTPTTASVVEADYLGSDCTTASSALDALGLGAQCADGNAAPDSDSVGKIYSVSPTGNIPLGTVVQLTMYAGETAMPDPAAPTFQGTPATVEPNGTLTVMWDGYTCPSGTGSVSDYSFTVSNGTIANGPSFPQNSRSAQVTAADADGQTVVVTYNVTCSGGTGGNRTSAESAEATVLIQTPTPEPEPTPTPEPTP
ncbi:protein kinase domain-containing protein (plasmid) [Coraliomargarita sp. W4R53]